MESSNATEPTQETTTDAANRNKVELQQVLGLTVCSNSSFDSDPQSSTVAYPAGCVVVLYNVRKNKQKFIINNAKKTISALSFSWDGKYLATGECGTTSYVRVWDTQKLTLVAELSGHKHGINCVAFSPNMKYVVSVGSQHDMIVNVWDWKSKIKVACNKVSCKVKALSFSAGGNYFVTVGNNHVKFWYLEYSRSTKYKLEPVPLMGRSAILGDQRNNYFCDVACGRGESADSTFAITKSGLLCEFNSRRLLDKWVELRVSTAISISVGETYIFIGCSEGIIRCFSPIDLHFICTLPRPHYLGVDVAKGLTGRQNSSRSSISKYPDVIAVTLDEINHKVTCVHNDHSLYVWDIRDVKKIGKSHSFLYHSACIWGIEMYPNLKDEGALPAGTFFTCANDDTIRIWNLEHVTDKQSSIKRNIFCSELLKILYTDPKFNSLCNTDLASGSNEKQENAYDGKNGVRCLKIRSDGEHLASGDRSGNLRIYDLKYMENVCKIEAHDSEILCLEYSQDPIQLLSSASRDRLVHIFDVENNYSFLQTLDDHNSSVTATKFIQHRNGLHLVSCGADKTVIFRKSKPGQKPKIVPDNIVVEKTTFYDMEVDSSRNYVLTACQDSKIRIYDVMSGKHIRTMSGALEEGTLIKITVDVSGTFVATSSTDKNVYIYDYLSGQCVASMSGHSELVTGLKFTSSRKQLISVSGDGCIFVWKLPSQISKPALRNMNTSGIWQDNKKSIVAIAKPFQIENQSENEPSLSDGGATYQFNLGQLPSWAKKQMTDDAKQANVLSKSATQPIQPRGRWAQRLDGQSLVVKSYLHTDSVIPYPNAQGEHHTEHTTIKFTSTESRNSFNVREEMISHHKQISISRSSSIIQDSDSGPQSLTSTSKQERVRHPTDSSSASSHRCDDGDAEDERSDSGATENSEMVYYPPCEEGGEIKDSSFHICAVKDEKPGFHRRGLQQSESAFSVSDKIEQVSDGDDSANQTEPERSTLGSFSMSTENLDRFDMREKYMLDTYESLNKEPSSDKSFQNRYSISSKHHTKASFPRTDVSGRGTPNQIASSKREELTRALNDAKRKLDSLGYKGHLSTSKSVGDLRNMSENEEVASRITSLKDESNDMRRSTSYGDISFRNMMNQRRRLPSTPQSGPQHAPLWAQAKPLNYGSEITDSDSSKQNRLSSTPERGLRHSSSASSLANIQEQQRSPLAKPADNHTSSISNTPKTLSNLNKSQSVLNVNMISNKNVTSGMRRLSLSGASRRLHYDDSSSSEASPTDTKSNTVVPRGIVARRMKAFCGETVSKVVQGEAKVKRNKSEREPVKSKSDWDLRDLGHDETDHLKQRNLEKLKDIKLQNEKLWQTSPVSKSQTHSEYIKSLEASPMDLPVRDTAPPNSANYVDINNTPLTQELCDKVSEELKRTTTFAMQLFQRITVDPHLSPSEKTMMTTTLAQGVWQAQQNLEPAASQLKPPTKPEITNPTVAMTLLQQYSDKLLSIVEQRITKGEK